MFDPRQFLTRLFEAAVTAADPEKTVAAHLPARPKGRTVVIGAGKGAAQMAAAFERHWEGPLAGAVVTRYGYGAPCERIRVIEAGHPVPDAAGAAGARQLVRLLEGLTSDDLVVALIAGGGSALLPAPIPPLTLPDEIAVNEILLASGAPIGAMNAIRKCLSTVKGGRLAALAHPARVVTLVVSDIPGDDPALVASGPTIPDRSTRQDALRLVERYGMALPAAVLAHLGCGAADEPPRPEDPAFRRDEVHVIASAALSLEAAAARARAEGIEAAILSDAIEGEARDVGLVHAAIAREIATRDRPFAKPVCLLSGGETTVTLRGKGGRGGRNTEFLLALALGIEGLPGIHALAADTDGIDGTERNAGAFADGTSRQRMREQGIDVHDCLAANDAWRAFDAAGDLFSPGPTGTNVNDFRAILVRA